MARCLKFYYNAHAMILDNIIFVNSQCRGSAAVFTGDIKLVA